MWLLVVNKESEGAQLLPKYPGRAHPVCAHTICGTPPSI